MQLRIGTYYFPANATSVTGRVMPPVRSASGRPLELTLAVDVQGTLFGSGQAALTAQEELLRAALMTPYRDLVLVRDDGGIAGLSLINNTSLSGCVVTGGPDFYESQGSEYVTTRRFRFSVEATYLVPGAASALVSWTQTVSVVGNGGPRRNWRFPLNARPVRQVVAPYSIIRYTQTGQAVGHLIAPLPPGPVFGTAYLLNESAASTANPGEPIGRNWRFPAVSWNYVFESDRPLVGTTPLPVF